MKPLDDDEDRIFLTAVRRRFEIFWASEDRGFGLDKDVAFEAFMVGAIFGIRRTLGHWHRGREKTTRMIVKHARMEVDKERKLKRRRRKQK